MKKLLKTIAKSTSLAATLIYFSLLSVKAQWYTPRAGSIYTTNKVGIGTSSPSEKLDVVGNIKLTHNLIHGGSNSWIFHTPDDGRQELYIAPFSSNGKVDWSKQTIFYESGDVKISNSLIHGGSNSWIFHTPDDGRQGLYIAPLGTNGAANWSKQTIFYESGDVKISRSLIHGGSNGWIFHTPDDGRQDLFIAPYGSNGAPDWSQQTTFHENGDVKINGKLTTKILTITGGADLAEPFPISDNQVLPAGSVVSINPQQAGELELSQSAYDKKVVGIISGAEGIQPGIVLTQTDKLPEGQYVALSGRVYVRANTANGAIEPGDLLTTSNIPGEAMKARNRAKAHGAIIGKAMTGLDEKEGYVLVFVSLQ